jgi:hypothetical protein
MSASRSRDSIPQIPNFGSTRGSKTDKHKNQVRAQAIKNAKKRLPVQETLEAAREASRVKKAAREQKERERWSQKKGKK